MFTMNFIRDSLTRPTANVGKRWRAPSDQAPQTIHRCWSLRSLSQRNGGLKTPEKSDAAEREVRGAMYQRLEQMTEDGLEAGGKSAEKAISQSGFDEELRKKLEDRIAAANPRSDFQQAFSQSEMTSAAGMGTRSIAGAQAWTGDEAVEDTALRMLTDTHKSKRVPMTPAVPAPRTRSPTAKPSSGRRIADARDKSAIYSTMKASGTMTREEREKYFTEVKERFAPGARDLPATLTGLASLANERIEEAIARGQFRNLPRGKKLDVDYNANSPFIDTTEYLMNKMIKKQDIVPPWIEKQQELVTAARVFRARIRNDWKRHAARTIASKGGTLQEQIQRAQEYAAAEAHGQRSVPENGVEQGEVGEHMSQISVSGQLEVALDKKGSPGTVDSGASDTDSAGAASATDMGAAVFRDEIWEKAERAFHHLSIETLNSQTRSYNLIAPQLAQKPYFSLERELNACFRDVAPHVATEIRKRALAPKMQLGASNLGTSAPLLGRFEASKARVHDEDLGKKGYGWRQFWADVWRRDGAGNM